MIAHNLSRWTTRIGGIDTDTPAGVSEDTSDGQPNRKAFVATDTLRRRYLTIPGRLATSGRHVHLHLPSRWPWTVQFHTMLDAIRSVELVI